MAPYKIPSAFCSVKIPRCMCCPFQRAEPHSSVGSVRCGLENRRSLIRSPARPIFFPRIDDSYCDSILFLCHRCLLFRQWLCGKAASGLKEYCAGYWLKELQESMDRFGGRSDITEILFKTALNTIQSIKNQYISMVCVVSKYRSVCDCQIFKVCIVSNT